MASLVGVSRDGGEDLWWFLNEVSQQLEVLLEQQEHCSKEPSVTASQPDCSQQKVMPVGHNQVIPSQPLQCMQTDWRSELFSVENHDPCAQYKVFQPSPPEAVETLMQIQQVEARNQLQHEESYYYRAQQMQQEPLTMGHSSDVSYYQQQYPQFINNQSDPQVSQALVDCAYCNWIARISSSQVNVNHYIDPE